MFVESCAANKMKAEEVKEDIEVLMAEALKEKINPFCSTVYFGRFMEDMDNRDIPMLELM